MAWHAWRMPSPPPRLRSTFELSPTIADEPRESRAHNAPTSSAVDSELHREPQTNIQRFLHTAFASSLGDDVSSMASNVPKSRIAFNRKALTAFAIVLLVVTMFALGRITSADSATGFSLSGAAAEEPEDSQDPRPQNTQAQGSDSAAKNASGGGEEAGAVGSTIVVYVSGAVSKPGIVELAGKDRVNDAIDAAGGFTDGADVTAVNLAAKVSDGAHIHVPQVGEAIPEGATSGAGDAASADGASSEGMGESAQININTASARELEQIPGIGPVTAQAIIEWRKENGRYRSVEELLNVSGIGEKTLASIREYVTASS